MIALRSLAGAAAGIIAFLLVCALGIDVLDRGLQRLYQRSPAAPTPPVVAGPPPQPTPGADLAELQREQQAILATYGWVDRSKGRVRIPIERAMQLLVDRTSGDPSQP